MKIPRKVVLATLVLVAAAMRLGPVASAEIAPQGVTFATPNSDRSCAGDADRVSWSPPNGVANLTGYRVVRVVTTMNPPLTFTDDLAPDQTGMSFTAVFGQTIVSVYARTPEGVAPTPFATGTIFAGRPPQPMQWQNVDASVGDGTATVPFQWSSPVKLFTTGGLSDLVRVTASTSGASVELPVLDHGVSATFTGLANGKDVFFSAVTMNACGSSTSGPSPAYTPGIAPTWTRADPPQRAGVGEYVYRFAAVGDPAPRLTLRDAPAWLTISPKGLVSGRPPQGAAPFTYSVVAGNGVGIAYYQTTDSVAGPFTVSVWAP